MNRFLQVVFNELVEDWLELHNVTGVTYFHAVPDYDQEAMTPVLRFDITIDGKLSRYDYQDLPWIHSLYRYIDLPLFKYEKIK